MSRLTVDNLVAVRLRGIIQERESWKTGEYRFQDLGVRIKDSGWSAMATKQHVNLSDFHIHRTRHRTSVLTLEITKLSIH